MKGKEQKREEALERQSERDKRSPEAQLKVLDRKLGVNEGADKERKRLLWQMTREEN